MAADGNRNGDDATAYDGLSVEELAAHVAVPVARIFNSVGSTMDEAHALAANGAVAGTLLVADEQTAGRGRGGRRWSSPTRGIWLTLIERPSDPSGLEVMSLRVGLAAARALDQFAAEPLRLKWPNDLYLDSNKLAGILVEARWRGDRPDWVAIGFGVNMAPCPDQPRSAGLDAGITRAEVLAALIPEIRAAAAATGALSPSEMDEYAARDLARGRTCSEPLHGRVLGIAATGELLIELADSVARIRTGSLVLG